MVVVNHHVSHLTSVALQLLSVSQATGRMHLVQIIKDQCCRQTWLSVMRLISKGHTQVQAVVTSILPTH